jgi:protein arginine kinase
VDNWISANGPDSDIIISSRIRLARNLDNVPFPTMMDDKQAEKVVDDVGKAILDSHSVLAGHFKLVRIKDVQQLDRQMLVEEYLSSPDLVKNDKSGALLINDDNTVSIMINEEDHVRIQCLAPGLQLREAWELADKVDDLLEENLSYAYDEQLGYLTTCPTNVGTGMRASLMMHLPALAMTNNIREVLHAVGRVGITVRGIYGEGSEVKGDIYQISNQISLGQSEDDIINNIIAVARQIIDKERKARQVLMDNGRLQLEDRIYRSLGIFTNARMLNTEEALELISNLRLGVSLGILKDMDLKLLNQLLFMIQPAHVQKHKGRELQPLERDIIRAELIHERIRR